MSAPDRLLVDGDAREAVVSHLERNLFVEAGAGTGKTTVLVRRVVRLFATAHLSDPGGLVAITFTEAAAAQLRDRIRGELERAAADAERPPVERERCLAAARRIDDAVITTLHGFAQRILAEHPIEAGLPPAFEVEEGIAAELAFVDRWRAFVDDLFAGPDLADDLRAAVTLGLPMHRLREVGRLFLDRWDRVAAATFPDPGPAPEVDATPVLVALRSAVARLGHRRGCGDKLAVALEETEDVLAALEAAVLTGDRYEVLRTLDGLWLPRYKGIGRGEVWNGEKDAVVADLDAAVAAKVEQLDRLRRHLLGRFLPLVARFTVGWAEERARTGRLHFHDLLVLARRVLWQPDGTVRRLLADRYQVLLVDEFQDTDPIQVELVVALAAADPPGRRRPLPARWQDVELAQGKVLVVGDPKQSIYGFRGADVTLWHEVRARFGDDVVTLSQNFRSVAGVLEWVNRVFQELMGGEARPTQPSYVALAAARGDDPDAELPAVEVFGGPGADGTKAADVRLAEAADVTAAIVEQRALGSRYADVALLLPTRTPLGPVERALDAAGVPYRVESRSLVWSTDVVREVLAILTAIEDPADEVAVVAALRSPGFACRDDELVDFRRAGGRWDPTAPPPEELPDDHPVVAAMRWLGERHRERWWRPVNELVASVVRERRLVELCFAQRRPRDHWRRLRFVVDQARAFVEAGGRSLADFLAWTALQTDEGAMAVETVVPEPDDDAVRILTVHGSKGLEFPTVVLAGLTAGGHVTGTRVLWGDDGPEVRVSVPYRAGVAFATDGFEELAGETKAGDADESVRLLYVAATRARDRMLVSVHHKPGGPKTHAQRLHELSESFAVGRRERIPLVEAPTLFDDDAPAPSAPTVAELAEQRAVLEAALRRAARPWAVAPTAIARGEADRDVADRDVAGEVAERDDDSAPAEGRGGDVGVDGGAGAAELPRRGGSAVGRAVHAVLEGIDLAARPDTRIVRALAERFADAEGVPDAADTVTELAGSALASEALAMARAAAGRVWREVPVVAPVGDRLVEGYVDLLFEAADGSLVVVDWKTDRARSEAEVDAALERYRLQGAGYAVAVEAATGTTVSSVRFVFCRAGGAPAVERVVTDLAAAADDVRAALR